MREKTKENGGKKMTAQTKLDWIIARITEGRTVYVTTALRSTAISPKTFNNWASKGTDIVKVGKDGSLLMAEGRKYVNIDYCKISAV